MNILYLLIPLSIVLIGFAVWAFFWAVGSGPYVWKEDIFTLP